MAGNKKIIIKKTTKIYVMAPSNTFTGGPEVLHQIAYALKKNFNQSTFMFYLPESLNPIHKNFQKYNLKYVNKIEDKEENILIIPEHYTFIKYALKYKNLKKILWWLSVDNYFGYKIRIDFNKFIRSIIKIPFNFLKIFNLITNYSFGFLTYHDYLKYIYSFVNLNKLNEFKNIDLHLCQSFYAYYFLKKYFKNIAYLSDYQREEIILNSKKKILNKKNLICYSNKSNAFIKKIAKFTNYKMIELKGFNSKQIINIFKKTKIYLDFGYHPGKDRMPREAALFNNCIIVNRRGSAKNNYDIPINKRYKFDERNSNLKKIKKTIDNIFNNYEKEIKYFTNYKKKILNEKKLFNQNLKKIFKKN